MHSLPLQPKKKRCLPPHKSAREELQRPPLSIHPASRCGEPPTWPTAHTIRKACSLFGASTHRSARTLGANTHLPNGRHRRVEHMPRPGPELARQTAADGPPRRPHLLGPPAASSSPWDRAPPPALHQFDSRPAPTWANSPLCPGPRPREPWPRLVGLPSAPRHYHDLNLMPRPPRRAILCPLRRQRRAGPAARPPQGLGAGPGLG